MRVSVTSIEQYMIYQRTDYMTLEELVQRLTTYTPPNEPMKIGTAFHTILETMTGELDVVEQDGYTFKFELDAELQVPEIKECKAEKDYGGIQVVGKVDTLEGIVVEDHKTTKQYKAESYAESYQWRFYLDMFNASLFRYNVFERREDKQTGMQIIKSLNILPLYAYPKMHDDVCRAVQEYAEFYDKHCAGVT